MAGENSITSPRSAPLGATCTSLIERLRANQPDAWGQLADLYGPLVYYWCRRNGLQPADSADVVQEVFASVFRGIPEFRHSPAQGRFRGWLWTITRNKIRDHFRARDDRQQAEGGTEGLRRMTDLPESSDDFNEHNENNAIFDRALRAVQTEFEPRTWEAFWRVVVAGQDSGETAAALGMSRNAVRLAKSRVLRRARLLLGDVWE